LLLYSSNLTLGVFQLAGHLLHTIKFSGIIITAPSQSAFKNLIRPLPYRIAKVSSSGDLLSRSLVHTGARDEVDYGSGANSERQNLDWFQVVCGGS
jgi:hypothetical protein